MDCSRLRVAALKLSPGCRLVVLLITASSIGCSTEAPGLGAKRSNVGGSAALWPALSLVEGTASSTAATDNPWLVGFGGSGPLTSEAASSAASAPQATGTHKHTPDDERPKGSPGVILGYAEGTDANKLLVLGALGPEPGRACSLEIYANGGVSPWRTWDLGDIDPDVPLIWCAPDGHQPACTFVATGSTFNGDDAVVLTCADGAPDAVGSIGVDPGSAWEGPGADGSTVSTKDSGLKRCVQSSLGRRCAAVHPRRRRRTLAWMTAA